MEIHEITQRRAQKLDEVGLGTAVKALGGMASQAIQQKLNPNQTRFGPVAAPGQEKNVANTLTDPIVKQQAAAAYQAWQQAVQAKLKQFNVSDARSLGRHEIETTLKNYINQRLTRSGVDALAGPPAIKNSIDRTIDTIVLNTLDNKWKDPSTADAWNRLVKTIRMGIMASDAQTQYLVPQANQATQLTPIAQGYLQSMAPGIRELASVWPVGQQTKVSATNNQAVNALLAGLGLLL